MRRYLKNIIGLITVLSILLASSIHIFALDRISQDEIGGFNQLIAAQLHSNKSLNLTSTEITHINQYKNVYKISKNNGWLNWDGNKLTVSSEIYSHFSPEICEKFILDMELYTELININLIKVSNNLIFESNAEEYINQPIKQTLSEAMVNKFFRSNANISPFADDCGLPSLSLGALVSQNYRELMDVYISLGYTEGSNAYSATVGYWIGKVSPGGPWDYKTKPGYSPYNKTFCCTYGRNSSKQNYHRTSEFIGNYNYGYTGRILFSLDMLKFGSSAVSGFDPKDVSDHPAIIEGYNDCGLIE